MRVEDPSSCAGFLDLTRNLHEAAAARVGQANAFVRAGVTVEGVALAQV